MNIMCYCININSYEAQYKHRYWVSTIYEANERGNLHTWFIKVRQVVNFFCFQQFPVKTGESEHATVSAVVMSVFHVREQNTFRYSPMKMLMRSTAAHRSPRIDKQLANASVACDFFK